MSKIRLFLLLFLSVPVISMAQSYDIVIKGGHVIDPKNSINSVMDVAIKEGKIAQVAKNIPAGEGKQLVDAAGLYVTPGLIDMHGHVFAGTTPDGDLSNGFSALPPDGFTFRVGVTTIVDAGGAGSKSFPEFKKNIIDRSQTRVLAFLNISSEGMRGDEYSVYQQDVKFMDPQLASKAAKEFKEYIVGVKVAHFHKSDFIAVDRALEAGKLANIPVMIDFGGSKPRLSIEDLFMKRLRPGDIFTHTYGQILETKESIVDLETGKLKPFVLAARKRGVIFDVGHGGGSFTYSQALPATKAGFYPETISTDLHTGSMNGAMKDMLNVMSKFMALKMDLQSVITASTWAPAKAIKREELGHISVGANADVAILNLRKGKFGFYDVARYKSEGTEKLECEVTIKGGKIVYDLNARSMPLPSKP
ncbi:amidohydrolase/deacetylase family metallohydrolase [Dyadobacter sp. CY323]|uniref:amidohydrolase/deacetylase family metallohydrolase n=1 Tax=Dyadobacter sp. CY323 TaxID=2907302 RepID=UPI001F3BA080|nr:amidohydrolase/deacetylase family metallohydrolase [Dyadobacter sp. CY323]MCE6993143.1 amidohydrolase/deacetylase family metallohydrolase [Dyadobacter sp. CY323]